MDDYIKLFYKKAEKYKYFIIILLIGLVFIINPVDNTEEITIESTESIFDLDKFKEELRYTISQIDGVGETEILLSIASTEEVIYASDTSKSSSDNYDESTVILSNSNSDEALVIKKIYPEFKGVAVVCEGGDSPQIKLEIMQLIMSVCDISSDKISISKMKGWDD